MEIVGDILIEAHLNAPKCFLEELKRGTVSFATSESFFLIFVERCRRCVSTLLHSNLSMLQMDIDF